MRTGLREHKFGIGADEAEALYGDAAKWAPLRFRALSCHIGSQIFDTEVFGEALRQMLDLADRVRTLGVGIRNHRPSEADWQSATKTANPACRSKPTGRMLSEALRDTDFRLGLEPGRSITGQAGTLLTRVLYRKPAGGKTFVVVDGAMNDLIRPALYRAHHEILPATRREGPETECDVVGPVCESGDFLATGRMLAPCRQGDILAVATAGAYGFVQSSNYNSRPRAAEVLVDGTRFRIVRQRETRADLIRGETV